MEPELAHHIGIAPALQQRFLLGRQPGLAAAGQLGVARQGAEPVERLDHVGGQRRDPVVRRRHHQRQEAAERAQAELHRDRRTGRGEGRGGLLERRRRAPLLEMERRLQGGVEPVVAGALGDRGDALRRHARHRRQRPFDAARAVAAQPVGAELGERRARLRGEIHRIARPGRRRRRLGLGKRGELGHRDTPVKPRSRVWRRAVSGGNQVSLDPGRGYGTSPERGEAR